jgi:membrane-bound lytic murein transglycosylase D
MRGRRLFLTLFVVGAVACASVASAAGAAKEPFPRFPQLEPNVAFWRDVFAKYTKHEVVFHDPYYLDVVYSVADMSELDQGSERAARAYVASETARVADILKRLSYAKPQTEDERRIAEILEAHRGELPDYDVLAERIRTQRGLADELCGTLERAQPWLPEMKHVLAANGVPVDLAALPIVESGFRVVAHSSVGAAGIWQFTHGTGRRYMRIDHVLDERRDPLAATEAAARYLRGNYEMLGSWPLAITGYNHGEAGVAAAVSQLGTSDLGVIVENYHGRAFGFASRNFYAEFLAARDVLRSAEKYCPGIGRSRDRLERVNVDRYVALSHLARCAGVDSDTLADLNPALQRDVASGRLYVPAGYRLWVPADAKTQFETAYASLPADAFHDNQASYFSYHRVRSGADAFADLQDLWRLGVGASELQRHSQLAQPASRPDAEDPDPSKPARGSGKRVVFEERRRDGHEQPDDVHRPSLGAWADVVARRRALRRLDGRNPALQRHPNPRNLRSGQTLKIHAEATRLRRHTARTRSAADRLCRRSPTSIGRRSRRCRRPTESPIPHGCVPAR